MKNIKGIAGSARMLSFYRTAYANHMHEAQKVNPVSKVKNRISHDHHVGLDQLETVYAHLRDMAEEYRSFFRNEQELENAFAHVESDDTTFVDNLLVFLDIYNTTLETLMIFDAHFGTDHHNVIKLIVETYKDALEEVYIVVEPDGRLHYVRSRLIKAYKQDASQFDFIVHEPGMAKLLLRKFRAVRAVILEDSDDHILADDIHGAVIDRKC